MGEIHCDGKCLSKIKDKRTCLRVYLDGRNIIRDIRHDPFKNTYIFTVLNKKTVD